MRLNKFLALATGMSRRAADKAITEQRVRIGNHIARLGQDISPADKVTFDGAAVYVSDDQALTTIMINKPVGYICSRQGQGNQTIYDLLPKDLRHLKSIGRLDKDSSGLLLLTNNGRLAFELTHPSFQKTKVYDVKLDRPLDSSAKAKIEQGINLSDGVSQLKLTGNDTKWTITMHEGRNRQIRRTFASLGYKVIKLHRAEFGSYKLTGLATGHYKQL